MFTNNFDPVAFNFFIFDIRWYSLSYILGILLGWIYIKKFYLTDSSSEALFDKYISYLIIGIIIGGRLGYVLLYDLNYFIKNPIEIIFLWNGGMSFHGGVLGVIIASYLFAKKNSLKTFYYLDLVSLAAPIGIFFGRVANFINSELYGRPTDMPWSVIFIKVDDINRHPSQIYEALMEGIVLFIILNYIMKSYHKREGLISGFFLIYYSMFRFFIEFTREPDQHIGFIFSQFTFGQIISFVSLIFGIIIIYIKKDAKI